MIAKEQAHYLVKVHLISIAEESLDSDEILFYNAKNSALITVYEILGVLFQHHKIDYWKEVKEEIKKFDWLTFNTLSLEK